MANPFNNAGYKQLRPEEEAVHYQSSPQSANDFYRPFLLKGASTSTRDSPNATLLTPAQKQEAFNRDRSAAQKFSKFRQYVNTALTVSDMFSTLITAGMETIMGFTLYKYYTTKDIPAGGRASPWAKDTQLWPTFLMSSASGFTFVSTLVSLLSYFCSKSRRARTQTWATAVTKIVHIIVWVAVAALYRIGKTESDLWGWSCSSQADAIQPSYQSNLNFSALCEVQTASWYLSIIEFSIKILLCLGAFYFFTKERGAKRELVKTVGEYGLEQLNN